MKNFNKTLNFLKITKGLEMKNKPYYRFYKKVLLDNIKPMYLNI